MQNKLQVTYRPTADLIPYVNNARTHSPEQVAQIAASIKEFGFNNPILLDGANGVIAGHGRLLAAQKLGLEQVPCIDLTFATEAQKKAYILADNRLAENAGWDDKLLAIEMEDLKLADIDLSLLGFDDDDFDRIFAEQEQKEDVGGGISPNGNGPARCALGDVFTLGDHRLICGDASKPETMAALMQGELADLYLTDPPYNVAYEGKTQDKLTIQNDALPLGDFQTLIEGAFKAADTVMHQGAAFYIWHADSMGLAFRQACVDIGWQVKQCLIWVKNQIVVGRQDYQWRHEPCLYGWKDGAAHHWYGDRKQSTILEFDKPLRNTEHPTMKPVELFAYLIKMSSGRGGLVLDSFAGSGTTIIACEQNGRKARCSELDPHYCDVIINRWQELTGKKATRQDGVLFDDIEVQDGDQAAH